MMLRSVVSLTTAMVVLLAAIQTVRAAEVEIGAAAPDFKAQGIDGKTYTLSDTKGAKVTVICFTCNKCPVAKAYEDRLVAFNKKYAGKGVKFIAINCNKTENLEEMKRRAEEKQFNFPYCYDGSGAAARAYGARVTPHLFVIDSNGKIAYRGAFDDSQRNPTKHYLAEAVDALLAGERPPLESTKAFGCSIKNDLN